MGYTSVYTKHLILFSRLSSNTAATGTGVVVVVILILFCLFSCGYFSTRLPLSP